MVRMTPKVCKENQLEEEELPQWTKKVIRKVGIQVLDDVEERHVYIKSVMWRGTVFLTHVVGETEGRGDISFTNVCERCKLFPVKRFLVVDLHTGQVKEEQHQQPYDCRKPKRLLTLQIGDTANEQVVFPAYGARNGDCDHMISSAKLVTHLMKGNKLGVVVKGLSEISKNRLAEALESFIAMDSARASVTMGQSLCLPSI